jgi:hypothetical protein
MICSTFRIACRLNDGRSSGGRPGLARSFARGGQENQKPDSDVSAPDATEQQESEKEQTKEKDAIPDPGEAGEPAIIPDPAKLPKRGGALPMETTDDPSA